MTERIYRVRCHGQTLYQGDNLDVAMGAYNRMWHEDHGQHQPTLDEAEWHEIKRAEGTISDGQSRRLENATHPQPADDPIGAES